MLATRYYLLYRDGKSDFVRPSALQLKDCRVVMKSLNNKGVTISVTPLLLDWMSL
ncbi:MAG: hypothetical protein ACI9FG_000080 [Crocinitomicaceae bacterium]|jgi:hypothetical protein